MSRDRGGRTLPGERFASGLREAAGGGVPDPRDARASIFRAVAREVPSGTHAVFVAP